MSFLSLSAVRVASAGDEFPVDNFFFAEHSDSQCGVIPPELATCENSPFGSLLLRWVSNPQKPIKAQRQVIKSQATPLCCAQPSTAGLALHLLLLFYFLFPFSIVLPAHNQGLLMLSNKLNIFYVLHLCVQHCWVLICVLPLSLSLFLPSTLPCPPPPSPPHWPRVCAIVWMRLAERTSSQTRATALVLKQRSSLLQATWTRNNSSGRSWRMGRLIWTWRATFWNNTKNSRSAACGSQVFLTCISVIWIQWINKVFKWITTSKSF